MYLRKAMKSQFGKYFLYMVLVKEIDVWAINTLQDIRLMLNCTSMFCYDQKVYLCSTDTSKISHSHTHTRHRTHIRHGYFMDMCRAVLNRAFNFIIHNYIIALPIYFFITCYFLVYFASLSYMLAFLYILKMFSMVGQ